MKKILSVLISLLLLINGFSVNVYGLTINETLIEQSASDCEKLFITNEESSAKLDGYEFVYENGLIKEIYINGKLEVENSYTNGVRTVKKGIDYCEFTYDEERDIISEIRNGKIITYLYKEQSNSMYLEICGFNYEGNNYYYTRDEEYRINGIINVYGELIVKYEYDVNGYKVENVLAQEGQKWVSNNDEEFVGNVNRIRYVSDYFDIETELYYGNGVFSDSVTGDVIINTNESMGIVPLSYGDELDYEVFCMQQECLNNGEFNDAVPSNSNWADECSDIEVVARVIYGENTHVYIDQKAIAYVILNRAVRRNLSPREVVLENDQFAAAKPSIQTAKKHSSGEVGWANAVYLACLLCYTLDEYDWEQLGVIPEGMGKQEYFRSKIARSNFTQSGNIMYYKGAAICEIFGAGYGNIESCSELDFFWNNYSDQNVHFSYTGGN